MKDRATGRNLMKLMKIFIILAVISPRPVGGQDTQSSYVGVSQEEIAKFFTETKIVGEGRDPERCSEAVLQRRREATPSLGVESSVGLGAALLIFIGVGVFAVGIAQAFQMERRYNLCTAVPLSVIILIKSSTHRSESTSTTTRIISTRLLMPEVKSPSV